MVCVPHIQTLHYSLINAIQHWECTQRIERRKFTTEQLSYLNTYHPLSSCAALSPLEPPFLVASCVHRQLTENNHTNFTFKQNFAFLKRKQII